MDLLDDEFCEEVNELCKTKFWDGFCDGLSEITLQPRARYSYVKSFDEYRELALITIHNMADEFKAIYIFADEDDQILFQGVLDLFSVFERWVDQRLEEEQGNIDIGYAMIRGMEKYIEIGSWHYDWLSDGDERRPIMWFGLEREKPEEGWILNMWDPENEEVWKGFWYSTDWEIRVPDEERMLSNWMAMECAEYLPSLEEVLKSCPIEVNEQDNASPSIRVFIQKLSQHRATMTDLNDEIIEWIHSQGIEGKIKLTI